MNRQIETTRESRIITKRIGSTDYEISVFLSDKSHETLADKMRRLIQSESKRGEVKKS